MTTPGMRPGWACWPMDNYCDKPRLMFTAGRLLVLAVLGSASGCAAIVGDECQDQTDCGQTLYCEHSLPGGYCTQRNCSPNACPSEAVCLEFEDGVSYCMRACEVDRDCRDGYRCVTDFGPHPFCNDEAGETPE
jgi:hypothetical protein